MKILLPSRRAAQALRTAFVQQADGQALFLPDMQPIGDVDELDPGYLSRQFRADDLPEPLPAISLTDRQMFLARLIQSRPVSSQRLSTAQVFRLAASLAVFGPGLPVRRAFFGFKGCRYTSRISQTLGRNFKIFGYCFRNLAEDCKRDRA